MNCIEAIKTRRSIRRYTDKEVSEDMIRTIIEAGMYAPSAVNKQPWHFVVIRDKNTFNKIMEVHPNSGMLKYANVAVLVCIDLNAQHDDGYGIQDCSAAVQNMLLATHELGLGAVWLGIYPRKPRQELLTKELNIPRHIEPLALISIGHTDVVKEIPDRYDESKVHFEKW